MKPVSELEGAELDAAVALALGYRLLTHKDGEPGPWIEAPWPQGMIDFHPSTDWTVGGPIIERDRIGTSFEGVTGLWHAEFEHDARADGVQRTFASGRTPLIAAMRAFVASKDPK